MTIRPQGHHVGMRFYPDIPARRAAAILRDLLVLLLLVLFAWIGLKVHDTVDELSVLGRGLRRAGGSVPLVGNPVEDLGRDGENAVHRLANVLGLVTFLLPAATLLYFTLPARITLIRRLTDAGRVVGGVETPERRRLVAMRAAFSLPYGQLLAHTKDPLGDLEAGRYEALVAAALEDAGLRA